MLRRQDSVVGLVFVISTLSAQAYAQQEVVGFDITSSAVERAAETRIRAALGQIVKFEREKMTLAQFVAYLNENGVPCQLDKIALQALDFPPPSTITITVKTAVPSASLRSTIESTLEELLLTWTIRNERLLITTQEQVGTRLKTKVYNVSSVVNRDRFPRQNGTSWDGYDFDLLIDLITMTIEPESWDDMGGNGSIGTYVLNDVPFIVLSQTRRIHEQIERLLTHLKTSSGVQSSRRPRALARSSLRSSSGIPIAGRGARSSIGRATWPTVPAPSWSAAKTYK